MKVGIAGPLSAAIVNGGVRNQMLHTMSALTELGVECTELVHSTSITEFKPDVIHVFTAGSETHELIRQAHDLEIPLVLSPVFYSSHSPLRIRSILGLESLVSKFSSDFRSEFRTKQESCRLANLILPNSRAELELLNKALSIPKEKMNVVPNGVEERFAHASPELFNSTYGIKDFILFVGQSSAPRKNVLKLMRAVEGLDRNLVIIGSTGTGSYGQKIRRMAELNNKITILETLRHDSDMLASAYAACHTFVLPSLYETPGIAALEASIAGAQIVITKHGGPQEYLGDHAVYIDPSSLRSIREGIIQSLEKIPDQRLKPHILSNYSWSDVAQQTLEQYKKLVP